MFNYEPMSEQQAMNERFQLVKDGEYQAVIDKADARVSSSGNNMIDLLLSVYDDQGHPHPVRDFLVFTANMMWKAIHCADSAGLLKEYEDRKFCPELIQGKTVRVIVKSQQGTEIPMDKLNGKPIGSRYPDKNVVEDYVKKADQGAVAKPVDPDLNDDVPW